MANNSHNPPLEKGVGLDDVIYKCHHTALVIPVDKHSFIFCLHLTENTKMGHQAPQPYRRLHLQLSPLSRLTFSRGYPHLRRRNSKSSKSNLFLSESPWEFSRIKRRNHQVSVLLNTASFMLRGSYVPFVPEDLTTLTLMPLSFSSAFV